MAQGLVQLLQYFNWTQFAIVVQSAASGSSGGYYIKKLFFFILYTIYTTYFIRYNLSVI